MKNLLLVGLISSGLTLGVDALVLEDSAGRPAAVLTTDAVGPLLRPGRPGMVASVGEFFGERRRFRSFYVMTEDAVWPEISLSAESPESDYGSERWGWVDIRSDSLALTVGESGRGWSTMVQTPEGFTFSINGEIVHTIAKESR